MNMLNVDDVKWIEDNVEDVKKLSAKVNAAVAEEPAKEDAPQGALAKMKAFVRKAVDCCIE